MEAVDLRDGSQEAGVGEIAAHDPLVSRSTAKGFLARSSLAYFCSFVFVRYSPSLFHFSGVFQEL